MTRSLQISTALILVAASFGLFAQSAPAADPQPGGKIFELRIYIASPGKLDALNARFRDHTCKLFAKHGIEVVGFWVPAPAPADAKAPPLYPPETLLYLVSFPSVEAQKKAWDSFKKDPNWIKVKADSEKDRIPLAKKVMSQNFTAVDYSPIK